MSKLPGQPEVVLPFEDTPDACNAIVVFAHEIPAGIEKRAGGIRIRFIGSAV